jgi:hypothetical protein
VLLVEDLLVDGADGRALHRIGDHDEVIPVLVSAVRRLDSKLEAFLNHRRVHRPPQVQALPDRPRRGQQLIDGRAVHVHSPPSVLLGEAREPAGGIVADRKLLRCRACGSGKSFALCRDT